MDAVRTAYLVSLIAIAGLIGTSYVSCSTPQSPTPEQVRTHSDSGFDRLSSEERAKQQRSGYGQ